MNGQGLLLPASSITPRRRVLIGGTATLSALAVALLSGRPALAAAKASPADIDADVRILNAALAAEHEAVAAYGVGAGSGLLEKSVLALAQSFQGHHGAHAAALAGAIDKLGGKPVAARPSYVFPLDKLKTQADVLRFAAGLEKAAVSAYLGAVPRFADRELARAAASILGDEAMHWAVLRQALGEPPVPDAFVA